MRAAKYSTRVEDAVADAVSIARGGRGQLRAGAALASWPGIVHGGCVVALLDLAARQLAGPGGPRLLEGRLTSSVPLETPLALEGSERGGAVTVSVMHNGTPLSAVMARSGPPPAPEPLDPPVATKDGIVLPTSERCLACGADNPLSLQARLRLDEGAVWGRVVAPPAWITRAGAIDPAVAPVLLDEIAWWLGALQMGEGGLTNRIALTLAGDPIPARTPLIACGRFADVEPMDRQRTFWRTKASL